MNEKEEKIIMERIDEFVKDQKKNSYFRDTYKEMSFYILSDLNRNSMSFDDASKFLEDNLNEKTIEAYKDLYESKIYHRDYAFNKKKIYELVNELNHVIDFCNRICKHFNEIIENIDDYLFAPSLFKKEELIKKENFFNFFWIY